jgi:hypothetical protein
MTSACRLSFFNGCDLKIADAHHHGGAEHVFAHFRILPWLVTLILHPLLLPQVQQVQQHP